MKKSRLLSSRIEEKELENNSIPELVDILRDKGELPDSRDDKTKILKRISAKNATKKKPINKIPNEIEKYNISFIFGIGFLIAQLIIILIQFIFTWYTTPKHFCSNNSTQQKCIPCPLNAICDKFNIHCGDNYQLFGGFCLPNATNNNQIAKILGYSLSVLKNKAGLYKCNNRKNDFLSQDELELEIIKKFSYFENFDLIFNQTIDHLQQEPFIVTKNISESLVFTSKIASRPYLCILKSYFWHSIGIYIVLIYCIYKYLLKKQYKYPIEQCLQDATQYILANKHREISETQLKEVMKPTCEDFEYVWTIVRKRLRTIFTIGHKEDNGEMYYFSQY